MKPIKTGLILLSLVILPLNNVYALTLLGKPIYVGADVHMTNTGARMTWSQVFNRFHPGGNIYFGVLVCPTVGIEFGHTWTTRSKKEMSLNVGATEFGATNTVNSVSEGRVRFKDTHLDFNFIGNINQKMRALFSVGLGLSRQNIEVTTSPTTSEIGIAIDPARGKSRFIPRAGIGLEGEVVDQLGWRTMVRYSNTGSIRTRGTPLTGRVFKDSISLLVGLNWRF